MDSLANNDDYLKQVQIEQVKRASFYYNLFTSPHGKRVLEDLEKECSCSHLTGNSMMDFNADVAPSEFMFLREGQNLVLRYIKRLIEFYSNKENR